MEIDIREIQKEEIDKIKFTDDGVLVYRGSDENGVFFSISEMKAHTEEFRMCEDESIDEHGRVYFYLDDIDNLILALKKAKEIWK